MHLVQGMTTVKPTSPQASKLTKAKRKEIGDQLNQYNKELKQQGRHDERLAFDEYLDYLHGKIKVKPSARPIKSNKPGTFRRETAHVPSLDTGVGVALKKESQKYTGTLVKGISQTHKSNAVPVINDEEIADIARMRRG